MDGPIFFELGSFSWKNCNSDEIQQKLNVTKTTKLQIENL